MYAVPGHCPPFLHDALGGHAPYSLLTRALFCCADRPAAGLQEEATYQRRIELDREMDSWCSGSLPPRKCFQGSYLLQTATSRAPGLLKGFHESHSAAVIGEIADAFFVLFLWTGIGIVRYPQMVVYVLEQGRCPGPLGREALWRWFHESNVSNSTNQHLTIIEIP